MPSMLVPRYTWLAGRARVRRRATTSCSTPSARSHAPVGPNPLLGSCAGLRTGGLACSLSRGSQAAAGPQLPCQSTLLRVLEEQRPHLHPGLQAGCIYWLHLSADLIVGGWDGAGVPEQRLGVPCLQGNAWDSWASGHLVISKRNVQRGEALRIAQTMPATWSLQHPTGLSLT